MKKIIIAMMTMLALTFGLFTAPAQAHDVFTKRVVYDGSLFAVGGGTYEGYASVTQDYNANYGTGVIPGHSWAISGKHNWSMPSGKKLKVRNAYYCVENAERQERNQFISVSPWQGPARYGNVIDPWELKGTNQTAAAHCRMMRMEIQMYVTDNYGNVISSKQQITVYARFDV